MLASACLSVLTTASQLRLEKSVRQLSRLRARRGCHSNQAPAAPAVAEDGGGKKVIDEW